MTLSIIIDITKPVLLVIVAYVNFKNLLQICGESGTYTILFGFNKSLFLIILLVYCKANNYLKLDIFLDITHSLSYSIYNTLDSL